MKNANRICIPAALLALAVLLVAGMPALAFDGPAIVGSWNCTSQTGNGDDATWTLVVKEDDGKLTATVEDSSVGDITVSDFKASGNDATFTAETGGNSYSVKLNVKGDAVEGTFEGDQASGTIKGTRKS